ncbi:g12584 [Coccomyxa viridis]|uniref:G12584 protein n=1 Tax=Coccomyxa viridis TaxID=1274662 RepID=A0ABP1GB16_9CHLO
MLIKAQLQRAPLCGRLCNFQIPARIRLPAHESGRYPSLKRFGRRNNKILLTDRTPAVCSSTVKELTPLTQSPAGNPLARLYVALLPGPLKYSPSLLVPVAAILSTFGAVYGSTWVSAALALIPSEVLAAVPITHHVAGFYGHHPGFCNMLINTAFSLAAALFVFIILPAGDFIIGEEPPEADENMESLQNEGAYRAVLYTCVAAHWVTLLTAMHLVGTTSINPLAMLGLALSLGCEGGLLFTVAHELLHSTKPLDKALSNVLLCSVGYMHWTCSHLAHHRNVATLRDPASARLGESLYMFLPRSVVGNLRDGVVMELDRLRARQLPFFCLQNRIAWWLGVPAALLLGTGVMWGPLAAALGVTQALLAIIILEDVNYIEHYGLQRALTKAGRRVTVICMIERTTAKHSWNGNWLLTNSVIFRLQRHSDHHAHASRPYQMLRNVPDAPQLPACYPAMMILALCPPLFHRIMDPRVLCKGPVRELLYNSCVDCPE